MKEHIVCCLSAVLSALLSASVCCQTAAQGNANALASAACRRSIKVQQEPKGDAWPSSYIWYPGQLAAHLQKIYRGASNERCVNVGYPGTFNPPTTMSFFRCRLKSGAQHCDYRTTGKSRCFVDGKWLVVKVQTDGDLPTLISRLPAKLWQASLDGKNWTVAETDSRYCHPEVLPTNRMEDICVAKAVEWKLLRNASRNADTLSLGKCGRAVLDFRQIELGTVRFKVSGRAHIRMNVGESLEEALCDDTTKYEQRALPVVVSDGEEKEVDTPERALRFLSISADAPCKIIAPEFRMKIWPARQMLQFECSNDTVNAMFAAGVATLLTSMHDFNLDGVKRDCLPWALDAVLSSMATNYVFGESQVARNGLSIALMPPEPSERDWGIMDYPLHALIGLDAYEQRFGNDGTADMFRDRIIAQMNLYMKYQDSRGFITATDASQGFIPGWSKDNGPETTGTAAYVQMMLCRNFVIASRLARRWGERRLARLYAQKADTLKRNVIHFFWDESRHAFVNGFTLDGKKDERISHYTQYWAVLTDIYPQKFYDLLYTQVVPQIDGHRSNVSYDRGYEAMAMVKTGHPEALLSLLVDVWYDWLQKDNTRFPENFSRNASPEQQLCFYNRPFGLSLCHGANGVPPVVLAMNGILGFSCVSDGHYRIEPHLMGMKWAKGSIPVKEGIISIELSEGRHPKVKCPAGCRVDMEWRHVAP